MKKLEELQKEVDQVPLWKEDSQLQDAVAMYLSGLVFALEQYERPIIGYLTAFSGNQLQEIAQRRGHISQLSMQFAHELAKLDKQLERSRKQFAEQYALS